MISSRLLPLSFSYVSSSLKLSSSLSSLFRPHGLRSSTRVVLDVEEISLHRALLNGFRTFCSQDLSLQKCVPCNRKDLSPMTEGSANVLKPKVPEWELLHDGGVMKLRRKWKVKNFLQGLEFFKIVGDLAEAEDHDMDAQMQNVEAPNVLTVADIFPNGYPMKVGKNNLRVDFDTLTCSESSCLIAVDILKNHPYQNMLTNSATVPEIYIHEFWNTMRKIKGQNAVTVTLNDKQVTITPADLRAVLLIPDIEPTEYNAAPTEETVLQFMIDIGYDEATGHHPDLHLVGWNNVTVEIWTHACGGLTENDFILAAKIDKLPLESYIRRRPQT